MVCLALIHWIVIYRVDGAFHPTNFEQVAEASGFLSRLAFFLLVKLPVQWNFRNGG